MATTYRTTKRKNIDDTRWDAVVAQTDMPYAYTWYLDAVTQGQWEALIFGDYDTIFPIPFNRKRILKQCYQPFLMQQLGPLGRVDSTVVKQCFDYLNSRYIYVSYQWHHSIDLSENRNITKRTNQVIDLTQTYDVIKKQYSKSTLRKLKIATKVAEIEWGTDIDAFWTQYSQAEYPLQKPMLKYRHLVMQLFASAKAHNVLEIATVTSAGEPCSITAFIVSNGRVINLLDASTTEARQHNINFYKIDRAIQRYAGNQKMFDFFGSNMEGIYRFNQSFGAKIEHYFLHNKIL